jgi:hypothetical protein
MRSLIRKVPHEWTLRTSFLVVISNNRSEVARVTTKSTLPIRATANPRRTKLASVPEDGFIVKPPALALDGEPRVLPRQTANPRRTRLMEAPAPAGRD